MTTALLLTNNSFDSEEHKSIPNNNNTNKKATNSTNDSLIPKSIQIASDLHLEFRFTIDKMKKIIPRSDILALCGDIGWVCNKNNSDHISIYTQFLIEMSTKFKYVLVIAGNHEFYYNEYHTTYDILRNIINIEIPKQSSSKTKKNVFFLQQNAIELDDVLPNIRILGCTLWTDYPKKAYESYSEIVTDFKRIRFNPNHIQKKMTEYKMNDSSESNSSCDENAIMHCSSESFDNERLSEYLKYPYLTPAIVNELHANDVRWLKSEMMRAVKDKKLVVILSHHAPTDFGCVGLDIEQIPVAYSTNYSSLESRLFKKPLIAWLFGHTHHNADIVVRTQMNKGSNDGWMIRLATNQMGYIYTQLAKYYLSTKVIQLGMYVSDGGMVEYSKTKCARNLDENVEELRTTVIDYDELLRVIHLKKSYVPKSGNSKECILM